MNWFKFLKPLTKKLGDDLNAWVVDDIPEAREKIGDTGMAPSYRTKALSTLAANTPTRTNVIGRPGHKHYLLHRTFGDQEAGYLASKPGWYDNRGQYRKFGSMKMKAYTSWSVGHPVAPSGGRTHIVSAWVPESAISFHPRSYLTTPGLHNHARKYIKEENEVIISPGAFKLYHHTKVPDARQGMGTHNHKVNLQVASDARWKMINLPKRVRQNGPS
jgi:hypothetical protein